MPVIIKIKPIQKWIGPETKDPGNSQFKKTYKDTKGILEYELWKLNAVESSVSIEMFIRAEDLRADGELRATVKPYRQGVILSFTTLRSVYNKLTQKWENKTKPLSYPCDTYNNWQDNLRAIALSLAKLRDVARYGVFKYEDMVSRLALPSAEGKVSTRDAALEFIAEHSPYSVSLISQNSDALRQAYRAAATALHPDKNGNAEDFHRLQEARAVLGI